MEHGFHVIVDDMRDLGCEIVLRTSQSALYVLRMFARNCPVEILYLDHDLGPCSDTDGYQLLKDLHRGGDVKAFRKIGLVSSNPAGRDNQKAFLLSLGYVEVEGFFVLDE